MDTIKVHAVCTYMKGTAHSPYLMACRAAMEHHRGLGSTGPESISEDI